MVVSEGEDSGGRWGHWLAYASKYLEHNAKGEGREKKPLLNHWHHFSLFLHFSAHIEYENFLIMIVVML